MSEKWSGGGWKKRAGTIRSSRVCSTWKPATTSDFSISSASTTARFRSKSIGETGGVTPPISPILFERNLAVVLAEEIEKSLVVAGFHVEQTRDDLIVPARFFQPPPDHFSDIRSGDFAVHEERVHSRPERLVLLNHSLVEIISHCPTAFAFRPQ